MPTPKCPRCGSEDVTPDSMDGCFSCNGDCLKNNPNQPTDHEYVYFQYDESDGIYAWPAVGVMYSCHKDEVEQVRRGKIKPAFV